jgi:hypothetical protein
MDTIKQVAPSSRDAESYRKKTIGPSARLRMQRHKARGFAKKRSKHPEPKPVMLARELDAPSSEYREHFKSTLRAVDLHIGQGEYRLFKHCKLMEKLKDGNNGSNLMLAYQLQLNLEMGLRLMRSTRARMRKEQEQDRNLRTT